MSGGQPAISACVPHTGKNKRKEDGTSKHTTTTVEEELANFSETVSRAQTLLGNGREPHVGVLNWCESCERLYENWLNDKDVDYWDCGGPRPRNLPLSAGEVAARELHTILRRRKLCVERMTGVVSWQYQCTERRRLVGLPTPSGEVKTSWERPFVVPLHGGLFSVDGHPFAMTEESVASMLNHGRVLLPSSHGDMLRYVKSNPTLRCVAEVSAERLVLSTPLSKFVSRVAANGCITELFGASVEAELHKLDLCIAGGKTQLNITPPKDVVGVLVMEFEYVDRTGGDLAFPVNERAAKKFSALPFGNSLKDEKAPHTTSAICYTHAKNTIRTTAFRRNVPRFVTPVTKGARLFLTFFLKYSDTGLSDADDDSDDERDPAEQSIGDDLDERAAEAAEKKFEAKLSVVDALVKTETRRCSFQQRKDPTSTTKYITRVPTKPVPAKKIRVPELLQDDPALNRMINVDSPLLERYISVSDTTEAQRRVLNALERDAALGVLVPHERLLGIERGESTTFMFDFLGLDAFRLKTVMASLPVTLRTEHYGDMGVGSHRVYPFRWDRCRDEDTKNVVAYLQETPVPLVFGMTAAPLSLVTSHVDENDDDSQYSYAGAACVLVLKEKMASFLAKKKAASSEATTEKAEAEKPAAKKPRISPDQPSAKPATIAR